MLSVTSTTEAVLSPAEKAVPCEGKKITQVAANKTNVVIFLFINSPLFVDFTQAEMVLRRFSEYQLNYSIANIFISKHAVFALTLFQNLVFST